MEKEIISGVNGCLSMTAKVVVGPPLIMGNKIRRGQIN